MIEPTLQERLRGGYLVTPEEAADALDAKDALIADLMEALEKAANRLDWTTGLIQLDSARDKATGWSAQARAALAKAKRT